MQRTLFGKAKNRVLNGETYSTNNDATILASMMAKYKQTGMIGYKDNSVIQATQFEGDLTGNASSATRTAVSVMNDSGTYYPSFVSSTSAPSAQLVNSRLTYEPSSNALTASKFIGDLSGNSTSTTNIKVTSTTTGTSYYPSFVNNSSTGTHAPFVNTNFNYDASNNALTASKFIGDLSGTAYRAKTNFYNLSVSNNTINNTEYLNSDLYLTCSSGSLSMLTIINPNTAGVSGLQYKMYNISAFTITLSNTSPFLGIYGSDANTLILPPNTWVQLNSNGLNWLVVDRSANFNLFSFGSGTTLDWSTNYQYLDNIVEFVKPDDPFNSSTVGRLSGNATHTGYVLTVNSSPTPTGKISIGSIITLSDGVKRTVLGQLTGTVGEIGTYRVNVNQTLPSVLTSNYTGVGGTGSVSTGTITVNVSQPGNFVSSNIVNTSGTNYVSPGAVLSCNTGTGLVSNPFYVISGSMGTVIVTTGCVSAVNTTYYATSSSTIKLPNPANVSGRMSIIVNGGNTPLYITTDVVTALFTGLYGQILDTKVFPNYYLLRPNDTVVLKSDGINWETQVGTSLGQSRSWLTVATNTVAATTEYSGTTDSTLSTFSGTGVLTTGDLTLSNLTGLFYSGSGVFNNYYPFPITINISVVFVWASSSASTIAGSSVTINQTHYRVGQITQVSSTGSVTNLPNVTNIIVYPTNIIFTSTAGIVSTIAAKSMGSGGVPQTFGGLFTLRPLDTLTLRYGKNSTTSSQETLTSANVYINRVS